MKQLFFLLAMVSCLASSAQTSAPTSGNKVATGGNAAQYTYVRGGLYVDSTLFFPVLKAINDTTLVGIDSMGKAYRIPKAAIQKWMGSSTAGRTFQEQNTLEGGHFEMGLNRNILFGSKGADGDSVVLVTESSGGSYGGKFIAGIPGFQSGQVMVGISGAALQHGNASDYGYVAANKYGNSISSYQGGVEKNSIMILPNGTYLKLVPSTSTVPDSVLVQALDGKIVKAKLPASSGGGSSNLQALLEGGNRMLPTQSLEVYSSTAGRPIVSVRADNAKSGAIDITNADSGRYMTVYGNMIAASDGMLGKAAKFYLPLDEGGVLANNLTLATRDYVNGRMATPSLQDINNASSTGLGVNSYSDNSKSFTLNYIKTDFSTVAGIDVHPTRGFVGSWQGPGLPNSGAVRADYSGLGFTYDFNGISNRLSLMVDTSESGQQKIASQSYVLAHAGGGNSITGTPGVIPKFSSGGNGLVDGNIITDASNNLLINGGSLFNPDGYDRNVQINGSGSSRLALIAGAKVALKAAGGTGFVGTEEYNDFAIQANNITAITVKKDDQSVAFSNGISARSIDVTDGTAHAGLSVDAYSDVYMNSNRGIYVNTTLMPFSYQTFGTSARRFGIGYFEQVDAQGIISGSTTYPNVSAPTAPANGCITYASGNHLYVICAGESSPTMLH